MAKLNMSRPLLAGQEKVTVMSAVPPVELGTTEADTAGADGGPVFIAGLMAREYAENPWSFSARKRS
jgi:hypothetical protein